MKIITSKVTREKLYKKEFTSEIDIAELADNGEVQINVRQLNPIVDLLIVMMKEEYSQ